MQQVGLKDKEGTEQAGEHCAVLLRGSDKFSIDSLTSLLPDKG